MSSRKFKTINIVILSIVYFVTSCLGSMSFAIASDTGYENVPSGAYYFENQGNGAYASDLDYYSIVLTSYSGQSQQRWEIIYVGNGYYNIRNSYTGKYLTSPNDDYEGSMVAQMELNTSDADRQQWSFTQVYLEEEYTFRIQAKLHEGTDIYLASSEYAGLYGYDLIQSEYFDYYIEWTLYPVKKAYLLGMDFNEEGHDHSTALTTTNGILSSEGYDSNLMIESSILTSNVKNYMQNCNFFAIRGHGDVDENMGCYMVLVNGGAFTSRLHANDIYNFASNTGINMSNCEVALFIGCQTANHSVKSLPKAAVAAGTEAAVGFETNILCVDAEAWTVAFARNYANGGSVDYSADQAVTSVGRNSTVSSLQVETQSG